jgi:hypothetical protein
LTLRRHSVVLLENAIRTNCLATEIAAAQHHTMSALDGLFYQLAKLHHFQSPCKGHYNAQNDIQKKVKMIVTVRNAS